MVEVGVRKHYRVNAADIEGKRLAVGFFLFAAALYQPAFEQNRCPAGPDQITGARYLPGGTPKRQLSHANSCRDVACAALLPSAAPARAGFRPGSSWPPHKSACLQFKFTL